MRKHVLGIISGAAVLLSGTVAAQAATVQATKINTVSIDFGSFFAPRQFDRNGDVYGVRANANSNGGSYSYDIYRSLVPAGSSLTPGACASAGFPGGWCQTAHSVAASVFGWDFHVTGAGVTIGVVDTGIDINNPEFLDSHGNSRVLTGACESWSLNPCTGPSAGPTDSIGGDNAIFPGADATHGTHVAGIAAGLNTGIAPGASILPVKVCSSNANSCNKVDEGMIYASSHGAGIVSVSIGGPILSQADIAAFRTVAANGALMVVAAGNSGPKDSTGGFLAGGALQDGVRGSMLVVGASGCNGPNPSSPTNCANGGLGGLANFSQTPSTRCEIHGGKSYCMRDYFVVAPGVDLWSSVGNGAANSGANYNYLSGTSMATPYVSGVAALVKSQNLSLTAPQISQIIISTADDVGAPGHDPIFGAGMVDVTRALAPISIASVRFASIPISGSNASSFVGTSGDALSTVMSGPLTGALVNSSLLSNVIMLDAYNRPYTVDLTKDVDNRYLSLTNILMGDQFMAFSPFGAMINGPLGLMSVSGLGIQSTMPAMLSGMYLNSDKHAFNVRDLLVDTQLTDDVAMNFGYKVDNFAGVFNKYDANTSAAYDGLFMGASAVNSPYASLTSGGSFLGTTLRLANDLHFTVAQSLLTPERPEFTVNPYTMAAQLLGPQRLTDQRQASATTASLNWDAARWVGVGLTASQTDERNGMLGGVNGGALDLSNNAKTTAVGVSARVGFGDGWVTTASYSEGITQLDLKPTSLLTSATDLRSRSYGVAVAKHGLFDKSDSLGLAVSRPIQVYAGGASLTAATAFDAKTGDLTYTSENLSLATRTPETDVELGYVTTFLDGALALQTNAAYQMNLAGQNGENALAVVSRAKINF